MDIVNRRQASTMSHKEAFAAMSEAAAEITRLRRERDGAQWCDVDDAYTPAIKNAYASGTWKLTDQARTMVSNRHSKGALVWLVTWLLQRIETAERERDDGEGGSRKRA
jgi:hypothetical protein